ncbi:FAM171 family protein [Acinetobacter sp. ANC 4973]|uniref:FAM171 family protein n=1 Tax=Acinetobacter sp. ANC 4973 TaxID=1977871 RepID=UPI001D0D3AC5|nr:FAM171 family protein [Acinetobacter sp. ANC 4973]
MLQKNVSALVLSSTGNALAAAEIVIAGQTFKADDLGKAAFTVQIPKSATHVVVVFKKEGFISQSLRIDVGQLGQLSANLLHVKQTISIAKIEEAQVIQSVYQNAQITIPENAFVLPNGQPATGAVTVTFTPWNIAGSDLNAMPANGVAQGAQGNIVNLISAGMITATFTNATGQKLQLAAGKTADIQMDLPLESINNQTLLVGSSIPMWHFDEAKGLWAEEGVGQVVKAVTSATGLAVHATVSHFSTWNWDFKFVNAGSVFVQCKSASVAVPCHITAKVKLKDGSGLTKVNSISAEGISIINMPSEGSIEWTAKDITGTLIGEKTSATSGNVIIDLGAPTTKNFVKCELANGTAVACSGKLNGGIDFSLPKEGGNVLTGLQNVTQLNWEATSAPYETVSSVYQYKGNQVSGLTGDVKIILSTSEKLFDKTVYELLCKSPDPVFFCQVRLDGSFYSEVKNLSGSFLKSFTIPLDKKVKVYLPIPPAESVDSVWINAEAYIYRNGLENRKRVEVGMNSTLIQFDFNATDWCEPWKGDTDYPEPSEQNMNKYCWYEMPQ